ncbi:MAG: PAQR family membrane homeostasis protein TrhA [Myxococcota bacterium]
MAEIRHSESPHEEFLSTVSHGVGAIASVIAMVFMLLVASDHGDPWRIAAALVFGTALTGVFTSSTLYHAMPAGGWKDALQTVDHIMIFGLIAGTYTPFTLVMLDGWVAWTMLGVQWTLATIGVTLKLSYGPMKYRYEQLALMIVMGWSALFILYPLASTLSVWGTTWVVLGGVMYSVGVVFYLVERIPLNHFWWHLFVMGGAGCHVTAIAGHVLP